MSSTVNWKILLRPPFSRPSGPSYLSHKTLTEKIVQQHSVELPKDKSKYHAVQNKSEANLHKYRQIEDFVKKQGVVFYPAGRGIGHRVMVEEGYAWIRIRQKETAMCIESSGSTCRPEFNHQRLDDLFANQLAADLGAKYWKYLHLDLFSLPPYVSGPDSIKIATPLHDLVPWNLKVDKVYLTSCINPRVSDLAAAAHVFKGAVETHDGKMQGSQRVSTSSLQQLPPQNKQLPKFLETGKSYWRLALDFCLPDVGHA
ncbi:MAG: hypothetical protein Q9178_006650 [Gyalolechia marmorata]